MALFIYLIKVCVCMAICYAPYQLVFRKYTFFSINRGYLLGTLLLSLCSPAVHIRLQNPPSVINKVSISSLKLPGSDSGSITTFTSRTGPDTNSRLNRILLLQQVYWLITASMGIKLLVTLSRLFVKTKSRSTRKNNVYFVYNTKRQNSSFFNLLFLDLTGLSKEESQQVIAHEYLHYQLLHSADHLFLEVCKIFFWFNPLIYVFARELRQIHEFEVDYLMTANQSQKQYGQLLLKLSLKEQAMLMNEFSAGELRGRLEMLLKLRSKKNRRLIYLPAVILLMMLGGVMILEPVQAGIKKVIQRDVPRLNTIKNLEQRLLVDISVLKGKKTLRDIRKQFYSAEASKSHQQDTLPLKDQKHLQVVFSAKDSVVTDRRNNILNLYGSAALSVGETKIVADYIKYDHQTSTVFARGVHQFDDKDKLKLGNAAGKLVLDSLVFDVKTRKAVLYN